MVNSDIQYKVISAADRIIGKRVKWTIDVYNPSEWLFTCKEWDLPASVLGFSAAEKKNLIGVHLRMNYTAHTLIHELAHCIQYAETRELSEDSLLPFISALIAESGLKLNPQDCL